MYKIIYSDDNRAPSEFYYIYLDFYAPGEEKRKAFDESDKNREGRISPVQFRLL